jgi:ABC-type amino acid transport substrate-binding protein
MRRNLSLLLLLFPVVVLFASCSKAIERIRTEAVTNVVTVPLGGPLIYQRDLELVGMDAELGKRIVTRIGRVAIGPGQPTDIRLRWITRSYSTWIAALENEEADFAIAILGISDEAKTHIQFSDPYYTSELVMLINPVHRKDIEGVSNLGGASVGVREATAVQALVEKQFPESKIVLFKTLDDSVLSLRRGEVDAVIDDRHMAAYSLATVPGVNHLEVLPGRVGELQCAVGLRKTDNDLMEVVNEVIAEIKGDQVDQWVREHIGDRLAEVEGRHALRVANDREAARPRRIAILVSKAANFDFDIYRIANLRFVLTHQDTGKSYRSSVISFQKHVGVSQATVPPGPYMLTLSKFRLKAGVVIEPQDASNVTVKIRLRRGAVDVEKS